MTELTLPTSPLHHFDVFARYYPSQKFPMFRKRPLTWAIRPSGGMEQSSGENPPSSTASEATCRSLDVTPHEREGYIATSTPQLSCCTTSFSQPCQVRVPVYWSRPRLRRRSAGGRVGELSLVGNCHSTSNCSQMQRVQ